MPEIYRFLAHHIFDYYYIQLVAASPKLKKALDTAIQKAKSNPTTAGEWMRRVPSELQGKIYKMWVSGRGGHRLFYLFFSENKLVIGVFISPEIRSRFNYEDFPWELFLEVALDFKAEKLKNFRII